MGFTPRDDGRGTMHRANVKNSHRLYRVLNLLRRHGPLGLTSMELQDRASVCAVGTCVSELRHNLYAIDCQYERTNDDGSKVYRYTIDKKWWLR